MGRLFRHPWIAASLGPMNREWARTTAKWAAGLALGTVFIHYVGWRWVGLGPQSGWLPAAGVSVLLVVCDRVGARAHQLWKRYRAPRGAS